MYLPKADTPLFLSDKHFGKETAMGKPQEFSCIDCGTANCDCAGKCYPSFCISKRLTDEEKQLSLDTYMSDEENMRIMKASAVIEHDYYCRATRVEETIRWAKKIGAKKIGIATCVGLLKEARIFARLLREAGFEVFGMSCKSGEIPKQAVGIPENCNEIGVNMCNPILQAQMLNREHTDVNVVIGLCVGHDSLFYKYSEAITTTLVTKDRVLGHNAAVALYTADSYYGALHDIE